LLVWQQNHFGRTIVIIIIIVIGFSEVIGGDIGGGRV